MIVSLSLLLLSRLFGVVATTKFSTISTIETIRHLVQQYLQQHLSFLSKSDFRYVPSKGPLAPQGFIMANLGILFKGIPEVHIQVDAPWKANTPVVGIGWVAQNLSIRHHKGHGTFVYAHSPLMAEAQACPDALVWAQSQGYQ